MIPRTTVGALLHSTELNNGEQAFLEKQHAGVLGKAVAKSNEESSSRNENSIELCLLVSTIGQREH
ncbi:hypothetical protein [Apibacter sp. HY039]|uniref:hypothetical protein n=1 Tax=Apibacter sp. HY039 TaxID=2501476 RepID=UPI000FEB8058|nr:hypothetical protein [Apibacter sp. HY039]